MSSPDKLHDPIRALQEVVEEAYRQRLSVWETKRAPNSPANNRASIVAKAGDLPVSPWKTRAQPAVVEAT